MINHKKLKTVAVKDCWKVEFCHLRFPRNYRTGSPYQVTTNRAINAKTMKLLEHFFAPTERENEIN